jgi:predicted dehydrogenase
MILAKSCHDMDLLTWLLNSPCVNVSSMGSLKHFKAENAPPGAPERCLDGCPVQGECPWYAPAFYMDGIPPDQWPAMVLGENLDEAGVERALKEGPYGRCVYRTDNNVVDHQQVLLLFENGVTASFTMCAFTARGGRDIRFMGTKGEIHGQLDNGIIEVSIFTQGRSRRPVTTYDVGTVTGGHNGGDSKIIADFAAILRGELINTNTIAQSVHGHIMAFAAEEARLTGKVIPLAEYTGKLERHL